MLRKSQRMLAKSFSSCVISGDRRAAELQLIDGRSVSAPCEWLVDNDTAIKHGTGQKLATVWDSPKFFESGVPNLKEVTEDVDSNVLVCSFEGGHVARVPTTDFTRYSVHRRSDNAAGFDLPPLVSRAEDVHRVAYKDWIAADGSLFDGLNALHRDGLVVIHGCPTEKGDDAVLHIARRVDHEMRTMYGTDFRVASTAVGGQPKNNVAYTSVFLDLHQDIVYLESMPGVQLLHCERFDETVKGGESIFLDALHVANELRRRDAKAFATLCEVPAAFKKDDMERSPPAQYHFAIPHITLNDRGDIVKVVWAPAFEAAHPLSDRTQEYYAAKREFCKILKEYREKHLIKFRLQVGECAMFHNARMLHGREAFEEQSSGQRMLHGTYLNVDSFRNRTVALGRQLGKEVGNWSFFNNSWR